MSAHSELAEQLVASGVGYAFGVTGSGDSLRLITELEQRGVSYYGAAHEASAALMAGGATQTGHATGLSVSIKGPGLANMLPGILSNRYESVPAISVSEAYSVKAPSFRMHKRLNHAALLADVAKTRSSLAGISRLAESIQQTRYEIPGPLHIDFNDDEPPAPARTTSNNANNDGFLEQLGKARRPIVIVGSLAMRRAWRSQLANLRVPVFTTAAAKGAMDETLPQSAGVYSGAGRGLAPEASMFEHADLVVGIGLRNLEVIQPKRFPCPSVLLDEVGNDVSGGFEPDHLVVDSHNLSPTVERVLSLLRKAEWGLDEVARAHEALRTALAERGWHPAACFAALNSLPYDYDVVLDTGLFCTVGEHTWQATGTRRFYGSSNGRFMGVALPSAIGIATASNRPVVCAIGDGGMRMYPSELKLAVAEGLPVCVILMRDDTYGSIACVAQQSPTSAKAVSIERPSWHAAIAAFGCESAIASSAQEVTDALSNWQRNTPLFIEAKFDSANYRTVAEELR